MSSETPSPWRALQDLVVDAARIQTRWAKAVVTTAQAAGRGDGPSPQDLLKTVGTEYQSYLRDLGRLNLDYARALQSLTAATGERLTEVVEDSARPHRAGGRRRRPRTPAAGASLSLDGPVGGTAAGTVTVANTRDQPADLSFSAGSLVDVSVPDAPGLQPSFTFDPGTVRLAPGAESTVSVLLALDADRFTAGHEYHGVITVLGGDGTQLDVTVRAVAGPPPPPKPSAARRASGGGTGKKKASATKASARKTTTAAQKKAAATRPARARRTPPVPG